MNIAVLLIRERLVVQRKHSVCFQAIIRTGGKEDMSKSKELYIRSKCCTENWSLVFRDGLWSLECLECGKSAGGSIKVFGPDLSQSTCECCGGTHTDLADEIFQMVKQANARRAEGLCPTCGKDMSKIPFRDAKSRKEFKISGMCQICQDETFTKKEEK